MLTVEIEFSYSFICIYLNLCKDCYEKATDSITSAVSNFPITFGGLTNTGKRGGIVCASLSLMTNIYRKHVPMMNQ